MLISKQSASVSRALNFGKMKCSALLLVLMLCVLSDAYKERHHSKHLHSRRANFKKQTTPPHCTQVTKDTDYQSRYKYDYPVAYIQPGQHEAYQQLYCVNPPTVNKAVTTVCDWAAPPQVQFTLGDEYMHVVRQDPTGRFLGNAVITTYQLCNHNRTFMTEAVNSSVVTITNV
ncbi:hypothetical protein SFRURICE_016367 [Spodoptera frugiperda]|uniref:SFRICE_004729 n=1 Tax=Spodoptera frugiperda TaxID=7108 RepID=A0A2H1WL31_SPOFR|nr:uncharacterized protein LOC118275617 [Spodoptera frugiperda]KAF9806168.1 hypothetical protein SFRURICE_016367 [Spodoptera frugiperda]